MKKMYGGTVGMFAAMAFASANIENYTPDLGAKPNYDEGKTWTPQRGASFQNRVKKRRAANKAARKARRINRK